MQVRRHIAWRGPFDCNWTTTGTATLPGGDLECQSGCAAVYNIDHSLAICTDFSETDYWAAGEAVFIYNFRTEPYFEVT